MAPVRFVGIDVGQRALHAVALTAVDAGRGRVRVAGGEVFTPAEIDEAVAWCTGARVAVGFTLASALTAAGHEVLETYPHGVFRRPAGDVPRSALPKKSTVAGSRVRVGLLSSAGVDGVGALPRTVRSRVSR